MHDGSTLSPEGTSSIEAVRGYWNAHVHDWKIAREEPGTLAFFEETEAYRYEKLHYLPRVVDFTAQNGKRVLDVGCGLGNDLSRFARGGAEVTGVDIAPTAIDLSRRNFESRGLSGAFHVMNGEAMDLPDASFDYVFCHTVLHFTPDPAAMVREVHRVLRPGGSAVLMTINRKSWLFAMHRLLKVEIDYLDAPVFNPFERPSFEKLMAPFDTVDLVMERFPVRTKVHKGLKAALYNMAFVDVFNALPRRITRRYGYHMLAFVQKR